MTRLAVGLHTARLILCLEMEARIARFAPFAVVGLVEPSRIAACGLAVLDFPSVDIRERLASIFGVDVQAILKRVSDGLPRKAGSVDDVWKQLASRLPANVGLSTGVRLLSDFNASDDEALRQAVLNELAEDLLGAAGAFSTQPSCVAQWLSLQTPLVQDVQQLH